MRILILSTEYPPESRIGGIGAYTAIIAPALAARGHDVHVLSCRSGQIVRDEVIDGVSLHRRGIIDFRGAARIMRRFPHSVSRTLLAATCYRETRKLGARFDVVETPEWMAEGLFFALRGRWPVVAHLHTPSRLLAHYAQATVERDLAASDRLERVIAGRADVVTSPSALLVQVLQERQWLGARAAVVIPHPIDLERWTGAPHVDRSRRLVLAVGRLERLKAPEVLVKAAAQIRHEVPDLEVVFIGESSGMRDGIPYGDWVAQRARDLSAPCAFPGWVPRDKLLDWYRAARVVAITSRFESFSMTAVEAAASGCPVVYSSAVGAGEVFEGSIGATEVPQGDSTALAEALRPYLHAGSEVSLRNGAAAAQAVSRRCAPAVIAARREECYEKARAIWRTRRGI